MEIKFNLNKINITLLKCYDKIIFLGIINIILFFKTR